MSSSSLERRKNIDSTLLEIAKQFDISSSSYDRLKTAYLSVASVLQQADSIKDSIIYPQGSINLGTEVKPVSDKYEYDIDLVFKVQNCNISAYALKKAVGDQLKSSFRYKDKLDPEGRRCWTLQYDNFHMDILPAKGYKNIDKIEITDKSDGSFKWIASNPTGYKKWFDSRMEKQLLVLDSAKETRPLPVYHTKTPLQRVVQLIKRHRDCYFQDKPENTRKYAPISILLTTIIAESYDNYQDIYQTLASAFTKLKQVLSLKPYQVINPINNEENFADKWNENDQLAKVCCSWLRAAENDFLDLYSGENSLPYEKLKLMFGDSVVLSAIEHKASQLSPGSNRITNCGLLSSTQGLLIPKHTFYGDLPFAEK